MSGFFINQYSLGYLAQLILTLFITIYLLSLRNKTRATWWLLVFFLCLVAFAAASIYVEGTQGIGHFYAAHVRVILISLAMIALLQLAYSYPRNPPGEAPVGYARWEVRAVLAISLLAAAITIGGAIRQGAEMRPGGAPTTSTPFADIWMVLASAWALIVFWRRSVAFSRREAPGGSSLRLWLRPQGRPARAAFAFLLSTFAAVAVLVVLQTSTVILPEARPLRSLLPSAGILIAIFLLALAYFNYAPENTSFLVKLVGISLVTVLLALTPVATIVAGDVTRLVKAEDLIPEPTTLHFQSQPDGSYTLTTLPPQFETDIGSPAQPGDFNLPFGFPFFGQARREVRLYRGVISFGDWTGLSLQYNLTPAILLNRANELDAAAMNVNAQPDAYTVTWSVAGEPAGAQPMSIQARLYPDGSIDLTYDRVSAPLARTIGVQSGSGGYNFTSFDLDAQINGQPAGADGMLTTAQETFQQALSVELLPLAYLLVVASLLTVIVFPLFYYVLLIKPLRLLTAGVRRVDQGDLPVQVDVAYQDEIGVITDAFNRMTTSVWETDQHLESLVAARTEELAASESRFRELFDNMTSGVAIFEPADDGDDYILRDLNQAGARIEKVAVDEAAGRPISQRLAGDELSNVRQLLDRAARSEPNTPLDPLLLQRPGNTWREVVAYRLPTGEIVLVFDDVTARIQAQLREQQLAALEERERIGRELHDELGQVLGFISAQSQAALALVEQGDDERAHAVLQQLIREAQVAHAEVRQYILGIRSEQESPQASEFLVTLDEYLAGLMDRYGMAVHLSLPDTWGHSPLTPEVETQLLRIIQEALTNVLKHAARPEARLQFFDQRGWVQVVIADDGPGFDLDSPAQDGQPHFGLAIMRERAEQVNGRLEIRSSPTSGTEVIVRVPRSLAASQQFPAGVRVLLADDHGLYLEGLRNLLAAHGYQVVGAASDGIEAQEQAASLRPDLILMDVQMPRCDGVEATRRIKARYPEIKVVMLTMATEGEVLFDALKAGASGYLLKSVTGDDFFRLLNDALAGETILSPALASRMLVEFASRSGEAEPDDEPPALTVRQIEVLTLVATGMSNQEIAAALHITERTVKYHVSEILSRLHLRSRHELARYAKDQGLLDS